MEIAAADIVSFENPAPLGLSWRAEGISHLIEHLEHLAIVATAEWSSLVVVSAGYFFTESTKRYPVVTLPCRPTIPLELVRIDINLTKIEPPTAFIDSSLFDLLKPFFVRLGKVIFDQEAKCLVIVARNLRE